MSDEYKIVTPQQFMEGYYVFEPNKMPNIIHKKYVFVKTNEDGSILVVNTEYVARAANPIKP